MYKVAFASCCRFEAFPDIPLTEKQPEWKEIQNQEPDYLFLLGDNIYMDYGIIGNEPVGSPKKLSCHAFENRMEAKYSAQFSVPHFKNLTDEMRAKGGFFATWDDHDFAWNDAKGNDVPQDKKSASMKLFKKWMLHEPDDGAPIYRYIDLPNGNPVARFIILDVRSYSDKISPQYRGPNTLESPSYGKSMLGEEQKQFLFDALEHDLSHTFICSGLTMTAGSEHFSEYEEEFEEFCEAVEACSSNVFWVAGDIHKNRYYPPKKRKRPCHELVSSGISINKLGLPWAIDDVHNWGFIEFEANNVELILCKANYKNGEIIGTKTERFKLL
ncbi:alkaline phosphatase D family protein [Vibrio methylphosphonaticus]|uniref:alkaline phosphatase D family protein n=1 Tax=Vibrio methylphosphonaticus TaxID=2946866 RepID=UPI00202A391C|nr:alkaline phosphatase D family protein [Vibrio methylphosphonaticus]MCL9777595.1 alkaline phosphatase D family protein [Vibrio methylphosphonaticus]